jgi:hypothetical protein
MMSTVMTLQVASSKAITLPAHRQNYPICTTTLPQKSTLSLLFSLLPRGKEAICFVESFPQSFCFVTSLN